MKWFFSHFTLVLSCDCNLMINSLFFLFFILYARQSHVNLLSTLFLLLLLLHSDIIGLDLILSFLASFDYWLFLEDKAPISHPLTSELLAACLADTSMQKDEIMTHIYVYRVLCGHVLWIVSVAWPTIIFYFLELQTWAPLWRSAHWLPRGDFVLSNHRNTILNFLSGFWVVLL